MRKAFLLIIMAILTGGALYSQADGKQRIAVLEFTASGFRDSEIGMTVSDLFSSKLVQTQMFDVLNRTSIDRVMEEAEFQARYAEEDQAVALAKLAGAEYVVIGNLSKLGSLQMLSVQLIEVESGRIIATSEIQFGTVESLYGEIADLVEDFTFKITGTTVDVEKEEVVNPRNISFGFGVSAGYGWDKEWRAAAGGFGGNLRFSGLFNNRFGMVVSVDLEYFADATYGDPEMTILGKIGPYFRLGERMGIYPLLGCGFGPVSLAGHDFPYVIYGFVGTGIEFIINGFVAPYVEIGVGKGKYIKDLGNYNSGDYTYKDFGGAFNVAIGVAFYF